MTDLLEVPNPPRIAVSVKNAARMMDVSEDTIRRLILEGKVQSAMVKSRRLVSVESLAKLIK